METNNATVPSEILNPGMVEQYRQVALGQLSFARDYLLKMLATIPEELWGTVPAGAPSHIAWQVGHLAVAQYGLMLFRQRGRAEVDLEIMPGWLRKRFGKGSNPLELQEDVPTPQVLLGALDRVHQQSLNEIASFSAEHFLETVDMPFAVFPNKLGTLLFCPIHESIHIGQIGLIRRMLGLEPIR